LWNPLFSLFIRFHYSVHLSCCNLYHCLSVNPLQHLNPFTHLKCQKHIGDYVGDLKYVKMTSLIRFIQLIMQDYDSKCLKMYLITLKVFKIC
jgi:hypothetical protein